MNKLAKKITAAGLCAALCLSGTGVALAQTAAKQTVPETETKVTSAPAAQAQESAAKDETVYVLAGADGSVQKIIVSDWIQNALGSDTLADRSDLENIENVKGDESYTISGESMKVWDAQGNDIYYQGDIEKELPVGLTVSYRLNGQSVTTQELAGKSGQVTIRFDYENRQYEMVEIDGKQERIYVPFAMLTGVILDGDIFRNVEVSNGKVIHDGDRTIVVGLAFPGLQEDLALDRDRLDIPNYVEITADAQEFELGMTITLASNEVFNDLDADALDDADGLTGSLDELTDAMEQLMDGSSALYDGLCTLLDRSGELTAGVTQLAEGAKSIRDGAGALDEGTLQLQVGLEELSGGLNALTGNSAGLNSGAQQVFETLLATADGQLRAAGASVPALSVENYAQVLDGVIAQMESAGAAQAVQTVSALKASLDSYNAFYQGLLVYTGGVDSAAAGAEGLSAGTGTLKAGTAQLSAGAAALYDGAQVLQNSMPALTEGITALRDGSMELSDGLKQFNEQGVQALVDLVDGDLADIMTRLRATVDVSRNYRNFAGISDEMDGQVKFIYRTDEIRAD